MKLSKRFWAAVLSVTLYYSLFTIHRLYSAPWWDLRFTDGDNGTYDTKIEDMLESYILSASSMVYLVNYSVPSVNTKITTSMNDRKTAGKDVKYVGDGDNGKYTGLLASIPATLDPAGTPIVHDKFLIIDPNFSNKKLVTGSGNYTSGGWGTQDSAWLTITDPAIINIYLSKYNLMFNNNFHNRAATTGNPRTTANGITVHTLFSSEDGPWAAGNIVDTTIRAATESVFFETTGHDETDTGTLNFDLAIQSVLDDAGKPNFFCEGVVNNMGGSLSTDFKGTSLANYNAKGGYIRQSAVTAWDKHHSKYVVIDMDWLGVGSVNASKSSSEYIGASGNDENHIFINDFRLARAFMREFSRHYALNATVGSVDNTSVTEIHDWVAPNAPTGLSVTPAASSFAVSWTAPADPGDFSRYYIFISTLNTIATAKAEITETDGSFRSSILRPEMQKKGRTTTSATLTTWNEGDALTASTNYYIGVVSVDKFGNESAAVTGGPYQLATGGNQPPNNPASMGQFKSDGVTAIAEGGTTTETTVKFKATISDPDGDNVKLQVEVKPKTTAFDGTGLIESAVVASGSAVTLTKSSLTNDNYHWRAIVVDTCSATSSWVEFGTAGNIDFVVAVPNTAPGAPTVTAPNGGEQWLALSSTHTITWTAATDDGLPNPPAALTYQIDYSTNNGGNWNGVTSGVSGTSYPWTVPNTLSNQCLVRVRAYDGSLYGNYDQSNAVFTIFGQQSADHIVISQIRTSSNTSTNTDFVELYNPTSNPINLSTLPLKLHKYNTTPTDANITLAFINTTIPARGFFLLANVSYTGGDLPAGGADATYSATNRITNNYAVYLSTTATTYATLPSIKIDAVGLGTNTQYETAATVSPAAGNSVERKPGSPNGNGTDTDNNSNDFMYPVVSHPRNSSSATEPGNQAPTAPTVTVPNGAENWTVLTPHDITWSAATDPNGDPLTYQIDYSSNNGTNWTNVANNISGTIYNWTVPNTPSAQCLVRIRAFDGTLYGNYDQSNAVFTISSVPNNPPDAPTGGTTTPDGSVFWINNNKPQFSWTFSDPDAGNTQSAYQLTTSGGYDTGKTVSATSSHTPGSALADGSWTWNVKVWDQSDAVSPVSTDWTVKIDASVGNPSSLDVGYNGTNASTLTWTAANTAPSGLKTYNIYRATYTFSAPADPNVTQLNIATFTTASWTDSTVLTDKTYYYGATAVDNATNISALSNTPSVYTGTLQSGGTDHIVISQVRTSSNSTTNTDFVELYNPTSNPIDLNALPLKLHKYNTTPTDANITLAFINTTIPARGFFLLANVSYTGGDLPAGGADATYAVSSRITNNYAVYLSTTATTYATLPSIKIDAVGLGTNTQYETAATVSPAAGNSVERKPGSPNGNGTDTDNNSNDFMYPVVSHPRNSLSATEPTGDTAAPGNVGLLTPANNAVNVSTAATLTVNTSTDTSSPINYWIQIALDSAFTTGLKETGWQTSTSTSPVLANSTTYYWRVKAKDSASTPNVTTYKGHTLDTDGYGKFVTAAGAVINNPPTAPTNGVTNPDGSVNWINNPTPQFSWTFNDPDAGDSQSAYQLIASGPGSYDTGKTASTSSSHTPGAPGLADGTWSWQVRCWDTSNSSSPWSAPWTVKIDVTVPTTIADLTAALLGGSIQLNWSAPTDTSGVKNYKIWRSTQTSPTLGANPVLIATDDATPGYIDSTPIYGTTNYYYVSTVDNATNESAKSNVAGRYIGPAGHIVISEVMVSSAATGGTAPDYEFVELYNPTDSDITITGWRLSKKTSGGAASNLLTTFPTAKILAHGFYLIASPEYNGPVIADAVYSLSNRLAVDNTVILYSDAGVTVVDKVGFGAAADYETAAYATNPDKNGGSIERKANATSSEVTMGPGGVDEFAGNGYDTDNNSTDFINRVAGNANPQNSNSQREPAIANITLSFYDVNPDTAIVTQTFTYSVKYVNVVSGDVPPDTKQVVIDGTAYTMNLAGSSYVGGIYTGNFSYSTTLSTGTHNYYFYFVKGPDSGRAPQTSPDVYNGPCVGPELEKISAYGGGNPTSNPLDESTQYLDPTKELYAYLGPGSNNWSGYTVTLTCWSNTIGTHTKTMAYGETSTIQGCDIFWVTISSGTDYKSGERFYYYIRAGDININPKYTDDAADDYPSPSGDGWVSSLDSDPNTVNGPYHYFDFNTTQSPPGTSEYRIAKRDESSDNFVTGFAWLPSWRIDNVAGKEVDNLSNNKIYNNEDAAVNITVSPGGAKANCTFYYTNDGTIPTQFSPSFFTSANPTNWNKSSSTTSATTSFKLFLPAELNSAGCTMQILAIASDKDGTVYTPTYIFKYVVQATPGTPSGDKDTAVVLGRGNRDGRYPTTDFDNYSPLRHSQNETISGSVATKYLAPGTTDEFIIDANHLTATGHDGITDIFYSDQVKFYLRNAYKDIIDVDFVDPTTPVEAYIVWLATTTDWSTAPSARLRFGSTGNDNQPPHLLKYHWLVGENTGLEGYSPSNPSDCTKGAPEGATVKYIFKVRDNQSTSSSDFRWIYRDSATKKQRIDTNYNGLTAKASGNQFEYKVLQDDITRPVAYLPLTVPGAGTITNGGVVPSTFTSPSWPTHVLGDTVTTCGSTVETVKVYVGLFDTADGRFTASGLTIGTSQYIDEPTNGLYVHRTFKDPNIYNTLYFGNDVPAVNTSTNTQNSGIKGGKTADSYAEGLEGYNSEGRRYTHDVLCYYVWRKPASSDPTKQWSWIDIDGTVNDSEVTDCYGTDLTDSKNQMIRIANVDGEANGSYETQVVCSSYTSNRVSMAPYNVDSDGNGIWVAEIPAPAEQYLTVSTAATAYLYYRIWACNGDNDPQAYYLETHGGFDMTSSTTAFAGSHKNSIQRGDLIKDPYGKTYIDSSDVCRCGRVHDRDYGWVDITRYGGRITSPPRVMIKSKVTVGGVTRTITTYLKVDPVTKRPTNIISTQVGAE